MKILLPAILLTVLVLAGCSPEKNTFRSPLYQGKSLMIGVIGEAPKVRESNFRYL